MYLWPHHSQLGANGGGTLFDSRCSRHLGETLEIPTNPRVYDKRSHLGSYTRPGLTAMGEWGSGEGPVAGHPILDLSADFTDVHRLRICGIRVPSIHPRKDRCFRTPSINPLTELTHLTRPPENAPICTRTAREDSTLPTWGLCRGYRGAGLLSRLRSLASWIWVAPRSRKLSFGKRPRSAKPASVILVLRR